MGWGALLQILMGSHGEEEAGKLTAQQRKILQDVYDKIAKGDFPQLKAQELAPSEAGAVGIDPGLQAAQRDSLNRMGDIVTSGGNTLEDRANQARAMGASAKQNSAMHQRVLESMARRGMGGSGAELVANLQNNQDSAERNNEAGMDAAANSQKRYYDAITGRAKMAGDMRTQDFDQKMRAADARDLRSRYNNDQQWQANKYNTRLPIDLLDAQIRASGGVARQMGDEAQSTRDFWASAGAAGNAATQGLSFGSGSGSNQRPASSGGQGGGYDPWANLEEAEQYGYE